MHICLENFLAVMASAMEESPFKQWLWIGLPSNLLCFVATGVRYGRAAFQTDTFMSARPGCWENEDWEELQLGCLLHH